MGLGPSDLSSCVGLGVSVASSKPRATRKKSLEAQQRAPSPVASQQPPPPPSSSPGTASSRHGLPPTLALFTSQIVGERDVDGGYIVRIVRPEPIISPPLAPTQPLLDPPPLLDTLLDGVTAAVVDAELERGIDALATVHAANEVDRVEAQQRSAVIALQRVVQQRRSRAAQQLQLQATRRHSAAGALQRGVRRWRRRSSARIARESADAAAAAALAAFTRHQEALARAHEELADGVARVEFAVLVARKSSTDRRGSASADMAATTAQRKLLVKAQAVAEADAAIAADEWTLMQCTEATAKLDEEELKICAGRAAAAVTTSALEVALRSSAATSWASSSSSGNSAPPGALGGVRGETATTWERTKQQGAKQQLPSIGARTSATSLPSTVTSLLPSSARPPIPSPSQTRASREVSAALRTYDWKALEKACDAAAERRVESGGDDAVLQLLRSREALQKAVAQRVAWRTVLAIARADPAAVGSISLAPPRCAATTRAATTTTAAAARTTRGSSRSMSSFSYPPLVAALRLVAADHVTYLQKRELYEVAADKFETGAFGDSRAMKAGFADSADAGRSARSSREAVEHAWQVVLALLEAAPNAARDLYSVEAKLKRFEQAAAAAGGDAGGGGGGRARVEAAWADDPLQLAARLGASESITRRLLARAPFLAFSKDATSLRYPTHLAAASGRDGHGVLRALLVDEESHSANSGVGSSDGGDGDGGEGSSWTSSASAMLLSQDRTSSREDFGTTAMHLASRLSVRHQLTCLDSTGSNPVMIAVRSGAPLGMLQMMLCGEPKTIVRLCLETADVSSGRCAMHHALGDFCAENTAAAVDIVNIDVGAEETRQERHRHAALVSEITSWHQPGASPLHFPPTLTSDERKFVHAYCERRGDVLSSKSEDKGVDRHVVVFDSPVAKGVIGGVSEERRQAIRRTLDVWRGADEETQGEKKKKKKKKESAIERDDDDGALHFDAGLTTAEREYVHSLAKKYGLVSKSQGVRDVDWHIVVRRHEKEKVHSRKVLLSSAQQYMTSRRTEARDAREIFEIVRWIDNRGVFCSRLADKEGMLPLHLACTRFVQGGFKGVTGVVVLDIVRRLLSPHSSRHAASVLLVATPSATDLAGRLPQHSSPPPPAIANMATAWLIAAHKDHRGRTALHHAARCSALSGAPPSVAMDLIDLLLLANEDAVEECDNSGMTPLHVVCMLRTHDAISLAVLRRLLAGAPCSSLLAAGTGVPSTTPLHVAVDWTKRAGESAAGSGGGGDKPGAADKRRQRGRDRAAAPATPRSGAVSIRRRARRASLKTLALPCSPTTSANTSTSAPGSPTTRSESSVAPAGGSLGRAGVARAVAMLAAGANLNAHIEAVTALVDAAPSWLAQRDAMGRTACDLAIATGAPAEIIALVNVGDAGLLHSTNEMLAEANRCFVAVNMARGMYDAAEFAAREEIVRSHERECLYEAASCAAAASG